jgi:hypothetical protein
LIKMIAEPSRCFYVMYDYFHQNSSTNEPCT